MKRGRACKTLVFDLETKYLSDEVGGWDHIPKMGLSVAVTYCVERGEFTTYYERDVEALIAALNAAELVIGFNILRFDYAVLRAYNFLPVREDRPTLDLMIPLSQALGYRPRLDDLAAATLGIGKLGNGLDAVRWFREGNLEQLTAYCKQDVQVTYDLYRFGKEHGYVLVRDRYRGDKQVRVSW